MSENKTSKIFKRANYFQYSFFNNNNNNFIYPLFRLN